jgi:hypothetical protein
MARRTTDRGEIADVGTVEENASGQRGGEPRQNGQRRFA